MEKILLSDLSGFAKRVLERIQALDSQSAAIVALSGELGAGKTTFAQALGKEFGVTEAMQSPTYVLMKSYTIDPPLGQLKKLIHIDAYRLDAPEQFAALKPEEFLNDPHNLILIEWPERLAGALPTPSLTISFSSENASASERFVELR